VSVVLLILQWHETQRQIFGRSLLQIWKNVFILLGMKWYCVSILMLFATLSWSQYILVSEGLEVRTDRTYELLGHYSDKYMVLSYGTNVFSIHNYDQNLFLTSTQEFELPDRRCRIIHAYPFENRFFVLYTTEKQDTIYVVNQSYHSNFEKIKTDTVMALQKGFQNYTFRYTFSEDKSKLGLSAVRSNEVSHYLVYDVEYEEVVQSGGLLLSDFDFYEEYRKSLVTNSGIFYLIFERNNFSYRRDDHAFFIYKFRDSGEQEESILPMKTLLTYDAHFLYDNRNNKLVICGLGSEKNLNQAEMIFQVRQDPKDPDYFEYATFVFHNNLLNDFYGKDRRTKLDYLEDIQIQDVVLMDDGSSILILEEVQKMERMTSSGRIDYYGSRFTVDYHYENLLLFHLSNSEGKSWQKLLPKRQFSNDDDGAYSSYFLFKNPNHLRLIYNDEIRNENTVSEYIIRSNGASLRTNLLSTDFQKLRLQVRNGMQISSHGILIPSIRGKVLKILLIDYLN